MKYFKFILLGLAIFGFAVLGGCVFMPYQLPQGTTATVPVNLSELTFPVIIQNKQTYKLVKNKNGYADIPAGKPVTIGNHYSITAGSAQYSIEASCKPAVTFLPQAGNEYFIDFNIIQKTCEISVLYRPIGTKENYKVLT